MDNSLSVVNQSVRQASSDDHLIELWLFDRGIHTQRAYRADVARFRTFINKPLQSVGLPDLVDFAKTLKHPSINSRRRTLSSVKSLLDFGHEIGYLQFNVGKGFRIPSVPDDLAHRIMPEDQVKRMIEMETNPRNHLMLVILYTTGIRCAELCSLRAGDAMQVGDTGQITVFGKGRKIRSIRLLKPVWDLLQNFITRQGRTELQGDLLFPISEVQVWRIVKRAAKRAGIEGGVSPHWFRHAHASHALDHGAPLHLVQATLGHASITTTGRYTHARPTESSGSYLEL